MKIEEAIVYVLASSNRGMRTEQIADTINAKGLFRRQAVIRDIFSNGHTWALVLKETGEPVGCMGYYAFGESNIDIGEDDVALPEEIGRAHV